MRACLVVLLEAFFCSGVRCFFLLEGFSVLVLAIVCLVGSSVLVTQNARKKEVEPEHPLGETNKDYDWLKN